MATLGQSRIHVQCSSSECPFLLFLDALPHCSLQLQYLSFHYDVIKEVSDIVDMVVRVNFKWLMTIFNVIIVCPVSTCNLVVEAMTTSGAAKTQQGFIVNLGRKRETRTKGK